MKFPKNFLGVLAATGIAAALIYAVITSGVISIDNAGGMEHSERPVMGAAPDQTLQDGEGLQVQGKPEHDNESGGKEGGSGSFIEVGKNLAIILVISLIVLGANLIIASVRKKRVPGPAA